jgi:hypothetical protein
MKKAPGTCQANGAHGKQLSFFPQPQFYPNRPAKSAFKKIRLEQSNG